MSITLRWLISLASSTSMESIDSNGVDCNAESPKRQLLIDSTPNPANTDGVATGVPRVPEEIIVNGRGVITVVRETAEDWSNEVIAAVGVSAGDE